MIKKITSVALLSLAFMFTQAQGNAVKLHLESIALGAINLSYERGLNDKLSLGVNVGYYLPRTIPGVSYTASDYDSYVDFNGLSNSFKGLSVVPEFRFYPGEALKGFYLGAYVRFENYNLDLAQTFKYEFTDQEYNDLDPSADYYSDVDHANKSIDVVGDIDAKLFRFGAGAQIGVQWLIADLVVIDWGILGLGYDNYKASGEVSVRDVPVDYPRYAQEAENAFNNDLSDVPFVNAEKISVEADNNSAKLKLPFGTLGLRSFLSVGIKF